MAANTPAVHRFAPLHRDGLSPYVLPASQWTDNLILVANTAKSYTLPTGTNLADSSTVTATIFRVVASGGPVWINVNGGTAAIPSADVTDGSASTLIPESQERWFSIPVGKQPLSFIAGGPVSLSIEAWF